MRLTLRTMLAYLDDILEPDDTEDIGKKIEESEFATNLVHRTRDSMRRLRLGVPALMGRGLAEDPNSVAEYLDNTLGAERVGEFEKICLESDVHLAEVASCHQILTLVLGEPAEIDPHSRTRMYGLAAHVDAPPVQTDSLRPAAERAVATPPPTSRRAKPEVPEYLRESRSRFWPVAAMVAVAALITLGGLVALGPPDLRERLLALVQSEPEATQLEDAPPFAPAVAAPIGEAGAVPVAAPGDPAPETVPAQSPADPVPSNETPAAEAPAVVPPVDEDAADNARPAEPMPTDEAPAAAENPAPDEPMAEVGATPSPVATPEAPAGDTEPLAPEPTEPAAALPADADKAALPEGDMPLEADATAAKPEPAAAAAEAAEPAEPAPALGRFMSKRDVLLRHDADSGQWLRLPSLSPLSQGNQLLSLPLFRPMITLSTNLTMHAEGAAKLEMVGWSDAQAPILAIDYGRWTMATVGKADNTLVLKFGQQQIQLTFVDADAELALDVHNVLPPGKDPENSPVEVAVDVYAISGSIRIREGDKTIDLAAPEHVALGTVSAAPAAEGEFPKWVNSEALSEFERRSTTTLEPLLLVDKPIDVILKELADPHGSPDRRREVRSLAMRSLAHLGSYEPCVAALNDPKEKLFWPIAMEELRAAIARNPEAAAAVRTEFEKQRSGDASALFRMLWGYSADDLKNGAARDLVESLDNIDSLDMRVMSFWNLLDICGPATHGYRPDDKAAKRRTAYNAWKEKARQGKILPQAASGKSKAAAKGG